MIRRLALALLAAAPLAGCDDEKTTAALREAVAEIQAPRPTPVMEGNYRLKLAPGETGRGGLAILDAGEGRLTLRGQYECTGSGVENRAVIPEQTVQTEVADGVLRAPLTGWFVWKAGGQKTGPDKTAEFFWDGESLPVIRSSTEPDTFSQALSKVGPSDAAISTAPIVTGFEDQPARDEEAAKAK